MLAARHALHLVGFVVVAGLGGGACSPTQIAASSTVGIIGKAWPAVERYRDPDLAESGIPATVATMEGLLEIRPEDTELRALIAKAYGSFGFGFLEDRMEQALADDDDKVSDHYRLRAGLAYTRCRELALGSLSIWEKDGGGAEGHIKQGLPAWTEYLKKFDDAEKQMPTLFWGAYCWGRYIGINRDDVNAIADLPYVTALSERAFALDDKYWGYAPHALRAGLIGTMPAQLGGKPEEAKKEFDVAIAATQGKNLMYLVVEAQIVAVALQDRALYKKLLDTTLAAPMDLDVDQRLVNQLAKRRAERYLAQIDDLFPPVEPPASEPAAAPTPAAPAPSAAPNPAPAPANSAGTKPAPAPAKAGASKSAR